MYAAAVAAWFAILGAWLLLGERRSTRTLAHLTLSDHGGVKNQTVTFVEGPTIRVAAERRVHALRWPPCTIQSILIPREGALHSDDWSRSPREVGIVHVHFREG